MNNIKRLLFGALSSLLLAAGFARAADVLDPISNALSGTNHPQLRGAPDCGGMSGSICDQADLRASPDCGGMSGSICDEAAGNR